MPNASPFVVRAYRDGDHDALVSLWHIAFPDDPPHNAPAALIARKLTVQPELLLVCEAEDELVGAVMAGFDGVRGWLHHLAVLPAWRRHGIATALVREAQAGLRRLGCDKLNLQVRATNLQVLAFYTALGFKIEERASLGMRLD